MQCHRDMTGRHIVYDLAAALPDHRAKLLTRRLFLCILTLISWFYKLVSQILPFRIAGKEGSFRNQSLAVPRSFKSPEQKCIKEHGASSSWKPIGFLTVLNIFRRIKQMSFTEKFDSKRLN